MSVIDDLLTQALAELAIREQAAAARLITNYDVALRRIQRELRTIDAQIAELIASGEDINDQVIRRQRWWREVEASIQREMARWSGEATADLAAVQTGGVRLGVQTAQQIATLASSPFIGRVYAEAFEKWVTASQPGSPLRDIIDGYGDKVSEAVLQRMTEGIGNGRAPRSIVREIMADVGGEANEARLMTITRTETMRAYRGASADTMGQLQERGIVNGGVWLCALGPRACAACIARHGTFYEVPPNDFHPACRCVIRWTANPDLVPGGGWKGKTGPEWFAEQDEATQRRMLISDARFEAYQSGVPLSDMVTVRRSELWGNTMGIKPMRDIPKATRSPVTYASSPVKASQAPTNAYNESMPGERVKRAIASVDELTASAHKWPDNIRDVPVYEASGTSEFGYYSPVLADYPHPSKVVLNASTENPEFVLLHEQGHFFDNAVMGGDRVMRTELGPASSSELADWRTAVYDSAAYKDLTASRDALFSWDPKREYLDYLASDSELWARSYSQHLANKGGLKLIDGETTLFQWADDDFAPIAKEIEKIFEMFGLEV